MCTVHIFGKVEKPTRKDPFLKCSTNWRVKMPNPSASTFTSPFFFITKYSVRLFEEEVDIPSTYPKQWPFSTLPQTCATSLIILLSWCLLKTAVLQLNSPETWLPFTQLLGSDPSLFSAGFFKYIVASASRFSLLILLSARECSCRPASSPENMSTWRTRRYLLLIWRWRQAGRIAAGHAEHRRWRGFVSSWRTLGWNGFQGRDVSLSLSLSTLFCWPTSSDVSDKTSK